MPRTVLFCLISYLILACLFLTFPGVQSDELLFGNVALGKISETNHIVYQFKNFPLLHLPYIGIVKAAIFYPIFKIFDVSVYTIRFPIILLTCISLWYIYKSVKLAFQNEFIALASTVLLATDATLLAMTRTDVGPVGIELFLKSVIIYIWVKFLKEQKTKILWWLPILMFLGVYNKLNFIWFVNALIGINVLLFSKDIRIILKEKTSYYLPLFFSVSISFGYYFFLINSFKSLTGYFTKDLSFTFFINQTQALYGRMLGNFKGELFYNVQYNGWSSFKKIGLFPSLKIDQLTTILFYFLSVLILIVALYNIKNIFKNGINNNKFFYFFLGLIVLTCCQMLPVVNATNPWHIFTIYPFFTVCFCFCIEKISKRRFIGYGIVGLLLVTNTNAYSHFLSAFKYKTPKFFWSKQISNLIQFAKKSPNQFIAVTWGVEDQLITFNQETGKYSNAHDYPSDMFQIASFENTQKVRDYCYKNYIANKDISKTYYIVEYETGLWFNNAIVFFEVAKEKGLNLKTIKEFKEADGKLVYRIFQLEKNIEVVN